MNELTLLFGSIGQARAHEVAGLLSALPCLCRGSLLECALGVRRSADLLVCTARFAEPVPAAAAARIAFWAWRLGGSVWDAPASPLRLCDAIVRAVPPGLLANAGRALLARFQGVGEELGADALALRLEIGAPQDAGLSFDRQRDALFVPSPLAPPAGDELAVEIRLPGGVVLEGDHRLPGAAALRAQGIVTAHRAAGADGAGSPAGFVLGLVSPSPELVDALEAHTGASSASSTRRAPRYAVRARARLTPRAEGALGVGATAWRGDAREEEDAGDSVENLSQGGAFVRTAAPPPIGAPVRLELELPGGELATAPGTVAFRNDRGVGIQFQLDANGEATIAEALTCVTARRRRALVVDDDLLARRMLGDALAACGFQVIAAADGAAGFQVLTEELLGLDVLVTDVHMPAMGGERLVEVIRRLGGERDLVIVVVTGDCDRELQRRLLAAGADRVLGKDQGPAAIAEAAERAVLARRRRGAAPDSDQELRATA